MRDELRQKIEAYLGGNLSSEEALVFEKQLEEDQELVQELKWSAQINFHLTGASEDEVPQNAYTTKLKQYLRSAEAAKVRQTIKEVGVEYHQDKIPKKRSRFLLVAATISFLLLSTIGYLNFSESSSEELFAQYYIETDLPSVITRGNKVNSLESGVIAFQKEEYPEALRHFEVYKGKGLHLNDAVYLYSGMTQVALGNFDASYLDFDTLINSNSLDASKGLWFKALAYLKADDTKSARQLLQTILSDSSNFNFSKAQELLEELD